MAAVALLALSGCGQDAKGSTGKNPGASGGKPGGSQRGGGGPRKFMVRTEPVRTRPVQYAIEAVGTLVEENRYEIPARVTGAVENVAFSEGDRVTTGQVLCEIDPTRYRLLAEQAKSMVFEKEASVRKAEAALADAIRETSTTIETARVDLELAESEYRRRAALAPGAVITAEDKKTYEARFRRAQTAYRDAVAAARTRVALAEAALAEERTALATARASLALAEDNLANSVVRAPIAGTIQRRSVTNGQYLTPGTEVALMVQTDPLRLRFTVPESRAAALSRSMDVKFTVPALPNEDFRAQVYDVGAITDPETREIQSWARIANPDGRLRPGYFASVSIATDTNENSIVIPLGAVLPTEEGMVVYVVEDGIAVRKRVQTGLQVTGDAIEILNGLEPGEQLVVEGMASLQNNVPVTVVNAPENRMRIGEDETSAPRLSAAGARS